MHRMDGPTATKHAGEGNNASSRVVALLCLHVAVLLFGVAALFGKWLALAPPIIVFGRTLVASVALGALMLLRREGISTFDWRLPTGGVLLAVHWLAFFQAIRVSTVATGLLGFASFPLFIFLLETSVNRQPIRGPAIVGAILVTSGLVLIVPELRSSHQMLAGLLWGLLSGLTFALLAIINRVLTAAAPAVAVAWWQNISAALCTLPLVFLFPTAISNRDAVLIVVLGVVCTALAHTLFIRSMKRVTAQTAGIVAALEPVYGIALAAFFIGELPTPRTLLGAGLIVSASLFVSLRNES
jgi:drug/metabolite transporter (DMT)-like permease